MREDIIASLLKCGAFAVATGMATVPVIVASANDAIGMLSAEGWLQLALQAGSTFILCIFLLWVWPQQMKFQRETAQDMQEAISKNNEVNLKMLQSSSEVHVKTVERITSTFETHDNAWRDLLNRRGYCPVRDADNTKQIPL
jgi:hypothetical protein